MIHLGYTFDHINYSPWKDDSDTLLEEFKNQRNEIDKFIYLINIYKAVLESGSEYLDFSFGQEPYLLFWKEIALQQNFINAVACYKSFLESYDVHNKQKGPVASVGEDAYQSWTWFRFIYEYRNLLYHRSAFAKDYAQNGDVYVDYGELSGMLEKGKKEKTKAKFDAFCRDTAVIQKESMKSIVKKVLKELETIHYKATTKAFDNYIFNAVYWISEHLYKDDKGNYADTFQYDGGTVKEEFNQPIEALWVSCHIFNNNDIVVGLTEHAINRVNHYHTFLTRSMRLYNDYLKH